MKFQSINPYNEEKSQEYPYISSTDLNQSLEALARGQKTWKEKTFQERGSLLLVCADLLEAQIQSLAQLIAKEMGKPVTQGYAEIQKCADTCRFFVNEGEGLLAQGKRDEVIYEPLGVILGVMPWNYPFWQVFRFAIPVLLMGNTTVIKHAPNIPETTLALETLMRGAGFNEDIVSFVFASVEQVGEMISDKRIAGLSLTGSERAGRAVAEAAGRHLKKVVLELGGSDPFIICEDADMEKACDVAISARFSNAGQVCISAKRFIVREEVAKAFEEKLIARLKEMKVGDPLHPESNMGPLARKDIQDQIKRQVSESKKMGGIIAYEAENVPNKGWFYPPTIMKNVNKEMPVVSEETFGPVAVIIPVKSDDEAIRVANDTDYGLGASIWTEDQERAARYAREIEAGTLVINRQVTSIPNLPFGGTKQSGFGRELGAEGLKAFTNVKTVLF